MSETKTKPYRIFHECEGTEERNWPRCLERLTHTQEGVERTEWVMEFGGEQETVTIFDVIYCPFCGKRLET